jgi:type VI secretion system protein ImpK
MDLFAYVVYLTKTAAAKQPPFEQVRSDILRLLSKSQECVRKGECSQEEYEQAHFMVCAWVDESILGSSWESRGQWQKEQLQRRFYGTFEAGEEVFERLNSIGYQQTNVREIYYLCFSLGFKGKFIHPEDDVLLEQLRTSNLRLLFGGASGIPSLDRGDLFPESYPSAPAEIARQKRTFQLTPFAIVALAAPLLLFLLLFLVYRLSLSGIADHFLSTVLS